MTKRQFIAAMRQAALASSRASGLPPGVSIAQAALESAWGRSALSRTANNYFGIKAHARHAVAEFPTSEYESGKMTRVAARFAKYSSVAECFACRDRIITESRTYEQVRVLAHDPLAFIAALAKHWATDPDYAEKLKRVYLDNGLDVLDREFAARAIL